MVIDTFQEKIKEKETLIDTSRKYVRGILKKDLSENIKFHTWRHTDFVVEQVKEIAKKAACSAKEIELLTLAAIFHDVGYTQAYEGHEKISINIAKEYLRSKNYPEANINIITQLIEATHLKTDPVTKLQKILVDADLAHLGKKSYIALSELLLEERNLVGISVLNKTEWNKENIRFLKQHRYYTKAARSLYNERKAKNLRKLRKARKALEAQSSISKNKAAQIIFKTSLRNHIDLTGIADKKANIMLSINALILSLGMPLFFSNLIDQPHLMKPAILFLVTSGITMILATLATRPVKISGKTNLDNLYSGKSNLFFFGNFYKLKLEDYQEGIKKVLANQKALDESIVNDLFFLGNALGHKFAKLRACYTFFAVGLTITFLSFIFSYFYYI